MVHPPSGNPHPLGLLEAVSEQAPEGREAWENEGGPAEGATISAVAEAHGSQAAPPGTALEMAVSELVFALYAEDIRMGIVRDADVLDIGGALSQIGGANYRRRAAAILSSLSRVSDAQILDACAAEPADMPRGAAARAELRLRGLTRS